MVVPSPLPETLVITVMKIGIPITLHLSEEGGYCQAHGAMADEGYENEPLTSGVSFECAECTFSLISNGSYNLLEQS